MNCQTLLWLQYHFHWKCNSFVHSNNVSEIKYNTKHGLKCFTVLANWRLLKLVCPWWWIHASLHDECFSRFWYFSFITQGSKGRGNKALYRKETTSFSCFEIKRCLTRFHKDNNALIHSRDENRRTIRKRLESKQNSHNCMIRAC